MDAMNDTVKIVVLDDGSTWAGSADVWTITREAYNRMIDTGVDPSDLSKEDIVNSVNVYDLQEP